MPCFTHPSLYYSQDKKQPLWLFIHLDNLIFGGTWNQSFKLKIKTFFEIKDLGAVKYALAIRITQNKENISLIQDMFVQQILTEFNTDQVRSPSAALPCNYKELKSSSEHITEDPKDLHYKAIPQTLKYLSGPLHFTLNLGKNLLKHSKTQLLGFTDSYWGGSTEKKSFSGSLIYFHGVLGWRAHKQKIVALSSDEAEYNAVSESAQDLLWKRNSISKQPIQRPNVYFTPTIKVPLPLPQTQLITMEQDTLTSDFTLFKI
ncbi:hypothetical protein O181_021284 [Austropuccinia psidii MF-1]|uniref:Reverse transcriptase Ty1/copia-type domain-containing protein n=1 Tax=Austropuccinia psidii MF-1 TaxID=1389203 RepID=A0A9Q3GWJ3_9BASI|nr:hypothetical protein [Austropuccinia psidii MF-1]